MFKFPERLGANQFLRVINLTQHPFSKDQIAEFKLAGISDENIIDTNDVVKNIITFNGDNVDVDTIQEKANQMQKYVKQFRDYNNYVLGYAMVGGAPFFQQAVNQACLNIGFTPLAAYTERDVVEEIGPYGVIMKSSKFIHKGFLPCCIVPKG